MTDPRMYAIARQVTDEVLGEGSFDRTNGPLFKKLADEGEKHMTESPLQRVMRSAHEEGRISDEEYERFQAADEQLDPVAQFLVWLEAEGYKIAKLAYWAKMPGIDVIPAEQVYDEYNKR